MTRRALLVILAALSACVPALTIATSPACADGDPASDILVVRSIYTPVARTITPSALRELQGTVRAADAAGLRVRVALILDRTDLGAVPQLFGHPDQYAQLLAAELEFAWTGAVIAVQPSGVGVRNVTPLARARRAVAGIHVTRPAGPDALARAASAAIRKIAALEGRRLATPGRSSGSTTPSSSSSMLITVAAVALAILGGVGLAVLVVLRRRAVARLQEPGRR